MSVNKVILVGNVGRNPEIKYVGSRPYATFSLATSDPAYTTAQGVQVPERTEWHNIVMWDRHAATRSTSSRARNNDAAATALPELTIKPINSRYGKK